MTEGNGKGKRAAFVALCVLLLVPLDIAPADAQERRTLMDMLFGDRRQVQERATPSPERPRRRTPPRTAAPGESRPATSQTARPDEPAPVEKMEDARKILVIGDFTAMSLGKGLTEAFAQDPSVAIVEQGSGSSGLVREDHLNWPQQLQQLLAQEKPKLVVVMIGANDRQAMQVDATRERFRSEKWLAAYEARIARLAKLVTDAGLPLLWVGLPAFESPSLTTDAVTLNGIYRHQVEKLGGEFVDIWDGFVSESGAFIVTGSDINGQPVRLRSADGIGFTDAGKRKLAFYVEKLARRHLGDLSITDIIRGDAANLPQLSSLPPAAEPSVKTQPISLTDPELDGGGELLGQKTSDAPKPAAGETPRELLVKRGELPEAPAGRVDYYRTEITGSTR
ncbi:SGNH/GDSL hydrolase family protein [Rhizobium straminoryzae]|uniref:DUF459 domain-containing protein n=1 Tax=Rhizobium straminoryzae TaxID=1387186 RepID=A0A549SQZ9_9HYPH|nr:DUF459 domain-containing protein [Rhizobium straminoryzae]TRL32019.1 DUF459 domain-containing protein [Rhizobium straminoryzae]